MPVEIVTIVNSSGKIISNGKHLLSVFKEAKAAYDEKKAAVKAERAVRRAQTYSVPVEPRYDDSPVDHGAYAYEYEYGQGDYGHDHGHDHGHRDDVSYASSRRSHRSRQSRAARQRSASHTRSALTERNLRTHSEVSSVTASRPPVTYRSPYAETAPRDMALSRPTLARAPTMPIAPSETMVPSAVPTAPRAPTQVPSIYPAVVYRSRSDPSLRQQEPKKKKEIDMNLAYGNIPPDLADRVDLDPAYQAAEKENKARNLMEKIESLLTEAHCLHHTATHIIEHLQGRPEQAAAVALTLAELSSLLGKMAPSFLGVIKGGSPAIFALLASPQFLIAAGVTVGVTVVMFGGWKIIKRIKEAKEAEAAMAFEASQQQLHQQYSPQRQPVYIDPGQPRPAQPPYPESELSAGYDEALVVEEELSTIESWRRGIAPFGEDESADLELISPEADRAIRSQYGGDDARTERSGRSHRSHRSHKSSKSHRSSHHHHRHGDKDHPPPSRREEVLAEGGEDIADSAAGGNDAASEAGSRRSHRSSHSHKSHRSTRTDKTTRSKRTLAIEDGSKDKENTIEAVIRPKKDNMLKTLFKKKKDADDRTSTNRSRSTLVRA